MTSHRERERRWAVLVGHRTALMRIARARTASREDAEDCVQEALTRAVEHPDLDLARAGAFLTTTTIRLTTDLHRSRQRQARLVDRVGGQGTTAVDHVEDIADHSLARWLAAQTRELSEQERAVLRARVAGESSREAAAALGISVRAVESSFTRARTKLQGAWAKVAVVVGALWVSSRRHATLAVPMTAVAVTVTLGPVVLLPSVTPALPERTTARAAVPTAPVRPASAVPAGSGATLASGPRTRAAAQTVPTATPAAAAPATSSHGPHRHHPSPPCETDCPPGLLPVVPMLLEGTLEFLGYDPDDAPPSRR